MFQTLDLRYAINIKTGRPDLVDIGLNCFRKDSKPKSNENALILK